MINIPISTIDDYLAERFLENTEPVRLSLYYSDTNGMLGIDELGYGSMEPENGIDFELSTCECQGLDDMEISDLKGKTVYTSSAYEFFEYYLDKEDKLSCVVNFRENTWIIKID